jgi:hypothetical protein
MSVQARGDENMNMEEKVKRLEKRIAHLESSQLYQYRRSNTKKVTLVTIYIVVSLFLLYCVIGILSNHNINFGTFFLESHHYQQPME